MIFPRRALSPAPSVSRFPPHALVLGPRSRRQLLSGRMRSSRLLPSRKKWSFPASPASLRRMIFSTAALPPNAKGIEQRKKLGITGIVDLRGERQGMVTTERKRAEALGIRFVNIRASRWSPPKAAELARFFLLVRQRPPENVYVHCWLGDDRATVLLAAYRIAFEAWTPGRFKKCTSFISRVSGTPR